jgi:hypothetical protein
VCIAFVFYPEQSEGALHLEAAWGIITTEILIANFAFLKDHKAASRLAFEITEERAAEAAPFLRDPANC